MNNRDIQREQTKQRIYNCAFRLFEEKGFANVKVQDIAAAAGISIGGLYHHYKSKEDIIDYGYYTFDEDLRKYYENLPITDYRQGIHALISYQMQVCVNQGTDIISITFRNQLGAENTYRYSSARYITTKLIENLQDAGLDEETSKDAGKYILRTARGNVYDWCCRKGDFDLVTETLEQVEMILSHYNI